LATGIGILGLLIPLFPGIVFLLIASYCFSKGSQRWYTWLLSHPTLGPPIVNWKENGSISQKSKIYILSMLHPALAQTTL